MSETNGHGANERVTMRTLDQKLEVVNANQRAEHWKTRVIVIGLTIAANTPALPALTGVLFDWRPW